MKYTILGKTGLSVSRLGFGCMRLPMTGGGHVDRDKAIPMLQKAVDLGINYFDTAVFYCNGDSQRVLGEAMEGRRDRVILSTKNHMHQATSAAWWERLEESLKFLRTDHIDVYNLHGMTWATWAKHIDVPNGKLKLLQRARDEGMIRHIACSFHDTPEALVKLAETGVVESITLQYNLLDRSLHEAMHRLKELGVGVVVMGPLGGGRLGVDSQRIRELTGNRVQSVPEAALRFVLAHPAVCVALSGMGAMDMLADNVRFAGEKEPFTAGEIGQIDAEVQHVRERIGVTCTGCGYCMPCPFGVQIPENFAVYNDYRIYELEQTSQKSYATLTGKAVRCTECGACLPKCPQKIKIPGVLRKVTTALDTEFKDFGAFVSMVGIKDEVIRARVTAKNLTDKPIEPSISIALADGATCEPPTISFGTLAPDSAQSQNVHILVPDGLGVIEGNLGAMAGNEAHTTAIWIPFFIIPRETVRWHEAKISADDFSGRQDLADTHGYRVGLSHDDKKIVVELDIRSQLQGLAAPGVASGGRIEMYVDMRPIDKGFGRAPYSEGAEQFFISLNSPDCSAASDRTYSLNPRLEKTADGVKISLDLPFAVFLKPDWPRPRNIGLDFMLVVGDKEGRELGYPTYGGNAGLYQNPGGFTSAALV